MNTNPLATTILCFGDSNTWGQKPDSSERYDADKRWTGILQQLLGEEYYVIEEGLSSRTTDLEYDRKPGRNGRTYLQPCLESHNPLDIVVLMLGTNDLKLSYRRSAAKIAEAIESLVDLTRQYAKNKQGEASKIILVSPLRINEQAPHFAELYTGKYDELSAAEAKLLSEEIQKVSIKTNCAFADAASVSKPGSDGIHLDEESERPLAQLIAEAINTV